jgi:hypothetical protein
MGKTLLARLLMEFFRYSRRPVVGFDLNPRDPALAGRFPKLVWPVDITDTLGQVKLFDQLIAETTSTKVVDLGYGPFEQFFAVMREIGFVQEARRRGIDPIVFFVTDQTMATVRSYGELQRRLAATLVPVHNEYVLQGRLSAYAPRMRRDPHPPPVRDRARRGRSAQFLVQRLHGQAARWTDRSP